MTPPGPGTCPVAGNCPKPCPTQVACTRVARPPTDSQVWLGDLAGFQVSTDQYSGRPVLRRICDCGWSWWHNPEFNAINGDIDLRALVTAALQARQQHECGGTG
jgi:hypothetical protein